MNIGNIKLENPLALAPMEDVTDVPFRLICHRSGADLVYTEFTSSEAIIRDAKKAMRKIRVLDEERPVGIQLFGGAERSMEKAAQVAEKLKPDFIDINCGCWVKDVAMRGEGAGLLRDLPHFERIVRSTVQATKLPVTVKTRLGWDEDSIVILDVARMVEQAGAAALTVHCRTRSQGHSGEADWSWLTKIKKVISIPLIGNGDITTPQDVKRMFETGCDGVMIGRGAIHNPWIFEQAKHYLKTGDLLPLPTIQERVERCIEHLRLTMEYRNQPHGLHSFRKHYAGYLHGIPNAAKLRAELMLLENFDEIAVHLRRFADQSCSLEVPA